MFPRKKLRSLLQILLSVTLLAFLLRNAGLSDVLQTLQNISLRWYIPAFLLFVLNIIIRASRWFVLLNSLNERPSFFFLLYLYFVGFFANNFIPSGFGGDVVKVITLRQEYGRGAEALSSVLMDRITGLMGSALIALAALLWNIFSHAAQTELSPIMWIVITLIALGIPTAFLIVRWRNPFDMLVAWQPAVQKIPKFEKMTALAETVHRYSPRTLLNALLITIPFTLSLVMVQFSIARALYVDLPLSIFFLFVPLIAIINLLPIAFNGLGTREAVYQFLFVPIGVGTADAIAMSLAFYLLRVSVGLIGGLVFALQRLLKMFAPPSELTGVPELLDLTETPAPESPRAE